MHASTWGGASPASSFFRRVPRGRYAGGGGASSSSSRDSK